MAHTRKLKSNNPDSIIDDVRQVLQSYVKQGDDLVVGLSGGVDSVVLLDVLTTLSGQMAFKLSAVHVNHGISENATSWSHSCCQLCYAYGVPISVFYLKIKKTPGVSLEALARDERYRIFARLYGDFLVLAQHLDDQAETVLLQLFRGAGVRGLSAMPVMRKQTANTAPAVLRPLLTVSRSTIELFARYRRLNWIHDESNDSVNFDRNFLRHEILPVFGQRYPNYAKTLQRTSEHMAEASQLLDELAESDARHCVISGKLNIMALRELSRPRAKNLLRFVFRQHDVKLPSAVKLEEILKQLCSARKDAQLHLVFGNTAIRSYQDAVYILPQQKSPWNHLQHLQQSQFSWQGELYLILKELGGTLHFKQAEGRGINKEKLNAAPVFIKTRAGGEHFSPHCKRPRRSLKNLMQEAAIPPWERLTLPLLYCGERLVWVPGIGIECEFQVGPEEKGVVPEWWPEQYKQSTF